MYALVDCNNFFVSCERAFQPKLRGKPVVVLSNNDGCIVSRSNEAKKLGIPMGAPYFKFAQLMRQNKVHVFSSNFPLYGDMSGRVMGMISMSAPDMEVYSVDEAFIELNGFTHEQLKEYAKDLRKNVIQCTGIPISIGIAPSKTLAKVANDFAKKHTPDSTCILDSEEKANETLAKIEVEDIWGIGRNLSQMLRSYGISTGLELKNASDGWIRQKMGVIGMRMVMELRGIPCLGISHEFEAKKSILCSRTFGGYIENFEPLSEAVCSFATRAAQKLRTQNSVAGWMQVFVRTNRHRKDDAQYHASRCAQFPIPTSFTPEITETARRLLKTIFKNGYRYRRAGVMFFDLRNEENVQKNLFENEGDTEKQKRLMHVIDHINDRFGNSTVMNLASGIRKAHHGRRERSSPEFTTKWEEIITVK